MKRNSLGWVKNLMLKTTWIRKEKYRVGHDFELVTGKFRKGKFRLEKEDFGGAKNGFVSTRRKGADKRRFLASTGEDLHWKSRE